MRELKTQCSKCVNRGTVPGNCHIACKDPDPNMKGDPHGIRNGWFFYPFLFDPIWRTKECANYKPKEVKDES